MNILALDLSLTSTGVCDPSGKVNKLTTKMTGIPRLAWYDQQVTALVVAHSPDVAVVEGYSFNSANHRAERIGELGGVVRLALWRKGVPVCECPPKCTKKFATGSGNASKDMVLLAAARRFPDFDGDNDMADALWMWALANAKAGHPVVDVPKTHLEALKGLEWPF